MFEPIILPLAKKDIKDAALWYNAKQKGLGKRFTSIVRSKVKYICQNPKVIPIRYDEIRCVVLDVFPFIIHFLVSDERKVITIIAIFHTSRDPKLWQYRK